MKIRQIITWFTLLSILTWACGITSIVADPIITEAVRTSISSVERIGESGRGRTGATLVLLEEAHNSRLQQLQHAIAMTILHDRAGLTDIALEGYLIDDPRLDLHVYQNMLKGMSPSDKAKIVVQLLKEGEISGAEFMSIVFDDIKLHPVEVRAEHDVELPETATAGLEAYLRGIAQYDLAWAKRKINELNDRNRMLAMTLKEHWDELKAIKQYAESKNVRVNDSDRKKMDEYIQFWEGRSRADQTMFDATRKVADSTGVKLVAMNIGALHTKEQIAMSKKAGRPFIVMTPLAKVRDIKTSDLTNSMYERKLQRRSVFASGLSLTIEQLIGIKKPSPVLDTNWHKAKFEAYALTNKIAMKVLKSNNNTPSFGLTDEDLHGQWFSVDPRAISLTTIHPGSNEKAVLIPIVAKNTGVTLYVKAGVTKGPESVSTVESILRGALTSIEHEKATPQEAENSHGQVQVSVDVFAGFAKSMNEARKIELKSS